MNNLSTKDKRDILNFIKIDDKIKEKEKRIKELKKEYKKISNNLIELIQKKNIKDLDIKIGNSKIRYIENQSKSGLSQQFLKEKIKEYFLKKYSHFDENKCQLISEDIVKYINNSRNINTKISLKRILG
jgi:hypothetical protein